ncbi:MAG TPA: ABC transporter ATP-binding protein [Treponemataceae bacterium]|nr:ABC transporter ATP-binding protein [Treponemataceae bacterium]
MSDARSRPAMGPRPMGGPGGRGPGGMAMGPGGKPKDMKKTLRRFLSYFRPQRFQFAVVLTLAILSTVFGIVGPKLQGKITTKLFDGVLAKYAAYMTRSPMPAIDLPYIERMVALVAVLYLVSAALSYAQQLVMSSVAQRIVYDMRKDINEKIHRLPLKYFDGRTHGEVMSRVTNDIDNIATTLQQSLTQFITSFCTIVGVIVMMLTISPALTLISILTLPVAMRITMLISRKSQGKFGAQQKELGALNGHIEEMYSGFKVVKAFSREETSVETFDEINVRLTEAGWKAQFISGIVMPMMSFVNNLGYVAICVVGGVMTANKTITLGDIQAFIQYSRQFMMPIGQLANIANVLQSALASAERVFEVLDGEEDEPDAADTRRLEVVSGEVSFKSVVFGYTAEKRLMDGISLEVGKGETFAIVGPTGAGKTTLVNLLMRFYEIQGGAIEVDGVDIRTMPRGALRTTFGMVLQDTWLFNGTIRENIAYGREGSSDEEIFEAARAAHADHFIRALPAGYETMINEEASNLSQGEKQLLTIARAILSDPPIMILDEATSSVDTRTEAYIQNAMRTLMKGRTNFVIAHRLSTIRDADKILVMDKGSIVEMGNHRELLAKNGFYADLYNSQFSGSFTDGQ